MEYIDERRVTRRVEIHSYAKSKTKMTMSHSRKEQRLSKKIHFQMTRRAEVSSIRKENPCTARRASPLRAFL